jgi:hypothetical protein
VTVYVDDMDASATVPNGTRTVKGVWCHMTADTTEELRAMAATIGLAQRYIQYPGSWKEHFDVTAPKKRAAINAGAVQVTMREGALASRARWMAAREIAAPTPVVPIVAADDPDFQFS